MLLDVERQTKRWLKVDYDLIHTRDKRNPPPHRYMVSNCAKAIRCGDQEAIIILGHFADRVSPGELFLSIGVPKNLGTCENIIFKWTLQADVASKLTHTPEAHGFVEFSRHGLMIFGFQHSTQIFGIHQQCIDVTGPKTNFAPKNSCREYSLRDILVSSNLCRTFRFRAVHKILGGPIFRGWNEILLLGKALKFGVIFQKYALKLIKN